MEKISLLIVENEYSLATAFREYKDPPLDRFDITVVENVKQFNEVRHKTFTVAIFDWRMNEENGDWYFRRTICKYPYIMSFYDDDKMYDFMAMINKTRQNKIKFIKKPIMLKDLSSILHNIKE